jgi:hypothetical protein
MDVERLIDRNLRLVQIEPRIQRVESELIIIKRIAFTLLLNILHFRDGKIFLGKTDSETMLTIDDTIAFLHFKVQPIVNNIIKSSPRSEEDMRRIPDNYNCILHLTKYLESVEETERLLRYIHRFSKFFTEESRD